MTISLNLSDKLDQRVLSAILSIHSTATELSIPFFIIGATARDMILHHGYNFEVMRATRDIDFAVQVEAWSQFDRVKEILIENHHFVLTKETHRLLSHDGLPVDIVPFGELAIEQNLTWPPDHDVKMSILGFLECYQNSIRVLIQNEPPLTVQVATLEGLALMKLISWDENPHVRNKDAIDTFIIMRSYLEPGNQDRLYEQAIDLFSEDEPADYDEVSARFLGRTMASVLEDSESIKNKVIHILNRETNTDKIKGLIQSIVMSQSFPQYSYQRILQLFEALLKGLCDMK